MDLSGYNPPSPWLRAQVEDAGRVTPPSSDRIDESTRLDRVRCLSYHYGALDTLLLVSLLSSRGMNNEQRKKDAECRNPRSIAAKRA